MGIGVSDFIQLDDVRSEIDRTYPNPGTDVCGEVEVEHHSHSHILVGDSFDRLCKCWLSHRCQTVIDPQQTRTRLWHTGNLIPERETLIYENGDQPDEAILESERLVSKSSHRDRTIVRMVPEPLHNAGKQITQFIETGMDANSAVSAALLYSGWSPESSDGPSTLDMDSFNDELVEEVQGLFNHLRSQEWTTGDCVYLGPNFGRHSCILEGEADFIVDDMLIDVKTTADGRFTKRHWRQLLAYYILNDIQRELYEATDRTDEEYPEITTVGVYFARFAELRRIRIENVIDDWDAYRRFRAWFVDRAIEENHDGRVNYTDYRAVLTDPYDFQQQKSLFDF